MTDENDLILGKWLLTAYSDDNRDEATFSQVAASALIDAYATGDTTQGYTAAIGDLESNEGPLSEMIDAAYGLDSAEHDRVVSDVSDALGDMNKVAADGGNIVDQLSTGLTPERIASGAGDIVLGVATDLLVETPALSTEWFRDMTDAGDPGESRWSRVGRQAIEEVESHVGSNVKQSLRWIQDNQETVEKALQAHTALLAGLSTAHLANDMLHNLTEFGLPPRLAAKALADDPEVLQMMGEIQEHIDFFEVVADNLRAADLLKRRKVKRGKVMKNLRRARDYLRGIAYQAHKSALLVGSRAGVIAKSRLHEEVDEAEASFALAFNNIKQLREKLEQGIENDTISSSAFKMLRRSEPGQIRRWDESMYRAKNYAAHKWALGGRAHHNAAAFALAATGLTALVSFLW